MRLIYVSIVLVVLTSIISVTWLLDEIAKTSSSANPYDEQTLHQSIHFLVNTHLIDHDADSAVDYLNTINEYLPYHFSLVAKSSFALPDKITTSVTQPKGVILASMQSPFIVSELAHMSDSYLIQQIPKPTNAQWHDLLLTIGLYISITLVLVTWLVPLTRRIGMLNTAAEAFGKGDLTSRVAVSKWSYVSGLETSFNLMAEQIEQLIAENKLLASSLSHDLRTPLACLRFGIDAAAESTDLESSQRYLGRVDEELDNMENMLDAFLDFASMSRKSLHIAQVPVNLNDLFRSVAKTLQPIAQKQKVEISVDKLDEHYLVRGDSHWLERAMSNLVSNAITHCRQRVLLSAQCQRDKAIIAVEDDGKGIPESERETVFAPFTRLEASRGRQSNHFGLGLAIVKKVAQWHQAEIRIEQSELGGARFVMTLARM